MNNKQVKEIIKKAKEQGHIKDIKDIIRISNKLKNMTKEQLDLLEGSLDIMKI